MVLKYLLLVLSIVYFVNCENTENAKTNSSDQHEPVRKSSRKGREIGAYLGMISCAMKYDFSCFMGAAEDYLEQRRTELLAEADAEVVRATGRSDPATRPSHLADVVGKLVSELFKMFQNGITGYFKPAREADDNNLNDIDSDENDLTDMTTDSNGALQYKFFLLALTGLVLHAIKLWTSFKKDHNPTKVIYYEHAQHQHHYGEDDHHGLWARAFNGETNVTAPHLPYHAQQPYLVVAVTDNIL